LDDIMRAAERIAPFIHRTPIITSESLDRMAGAQLFFKCESFQKVGAFKFRGATNAVLSLTDEEAARGVATHSSGNHAQALALAARNRGIAAHIVMPRGSNKVKVEAVEEYGGKITWCEPTLEARESTLEQVQKDTGATFIHPYDDPRVITGQGTAALELMTDVPDLDTVVVPVGGGGLLAGTAAAVRGLSESARVWGAEPEAADDAYRSLNSGHIIPSVNPDTIADGLKTSLGTLNFMIIQALVDDIALVAEEEIVAAMRVFMERAKVVIEPSAAVAVAALLARHVPGERIGVIVSGGNVDFSRARPI